MDKYEAKLEEIRKVLGLNQDEEVAPEPSKEAAESNEPKPSTEESMVTMSEFVAFKQEVAASLDKLVSSFAETMEQIGKGPETVPVEASEETPAMSAEEIANAEVVDLTEDPAEVGVPAEPEAAEAAPAEPVEAPAEEPAAEDVQAAPVEEEPAVEAVTHNPEEQVQAKLSIPRPNKRMNPTASRVAAAFSAINAK